MLIRKYTFPVGPRDVWIRTSSNVRPKRLLYKIFTPDARLTCLDDEDGKWKPEKWTRKLKIQPLLEHCLSSVTNCRRYRIMRHIRKFHYVTLTLHGAVTGPRLWFGSRATASELTGGRTHRACCKIIEWRKTVKAKHTHARTHSLRFKPKEQGSGNRLIGNHEDSKSQQYKKKRRRN